jgi:hypothetical protein
MPQRFQFPDATAAPEATAFLRCITMTLKPDSEENYVATVMFMRDTAIHSVSSVGEALPGQCGSFQRYGKEIASVDLSYFWFTKAPSFAFNSPLRFAKDEVLTVVSPIRIMVYLMGYESC